jgi:hypothetical protein
MDFKTIAEIMAPYWALGILVIYLVILSGHKSLVRVEKIPLLKWGIFLGLITVYRLTLIKLFPGFRGMGQSAGNIAFLPWTVALTVFWEDACHGLPLLILKKLLPKTRVWSLIYILVMGLTMIEFGSGHLYQGPMAALFLSFYIPYSVNKGERYGFGTIMLCHMMYDLVTILFTKYMLGM